MNGDALELSNMIQQAERNLSKQISDLRADVAETQGNLGARVSQLEDDTKNDAKWRRLQYVIAPVSVGLHILARKLGLNI